MKFILTPKRIIMRPWIILFFLPFFLGCEKIEPDLHNLKSDQQTIMEFISDERNKDQYSLFSEIAELAGLRNILSVRGPYTLFLPENTAVREYLNELGISSPGQMGPETARELVYNHLIDAMINSGSIGLGALEKVNALGDFLSSEFVGPDIYINKESRIIRRDINTANGVIHAINKVVKPVHEPVSEVLAALDGYSIFHEALRRTGLLDTLQIIEFDYGQFRARTRYTLLSVSDSIYAAHGIHSIDDLINLLTNEPEMINQRDNELFLYMEYHCIAGTHYMNHLRRQQYPNIANENFINITLDNDYEINKSGDKYTTFYIPGSNIPAKNGVVHTINEVMEIPLPVPWKVVHDVTDYIDFRESDFYKRRETLRPGENIFEKFFDGENTFEFIKWEGDYLQYYYRVNDWLAGSYLNGDCLTMNGFWSIEITTPRIMKGRYEIHAFTRIGPDCLVYIDGVLQEHLYKMSEGGDNLIPRYVGTVEWEESTTHTIRLESLTSGLLFYDRLEFTPIAN